MIKSLKVSLGRKGESKEEDTNGQYCITSQHFVVNVHLHSRGSPAGLPESHHVFPLLHHKVHHPTNEYSQGHHARRGNRDRDRDRDGQGVAAIPSVASAFIRGVKKYTWWVC